MWTSGRNSAKNQSACSTIVGTLDPGKKKRYLKKISYALNIHPSTFHGLCRISQLGPNISPPNGVTVAMRNLEQIFKVDFAGPVSAPDFPPLHYYLYPNLSLFSLTPISAFMLLSLANHQNSKKVNSRKIQINKMTWILNCENLKWKSVFGYGWES